MQTARELIVTQAQCNKAKRWATRNGYTGARGGWIYSPVGHIVCQGWANFYRRYRSKIEIETD